MGGKDGKGASIDSRRNHIRIGCCIQEAGLALSKETRLLWSLSRDRCYQMSNRFAWAWKLTELGKPVILIYLGFLVCDEMQDGTSQNLIASDNDWERMVESWRHNWEVAAKVKAELAYNPLPDAVSLPCPNKNNYGC